jgi:hypothetical protein
MGVQADASQLGKCSLAISNKISQISRSELKLPPAAANISKMRRVLMRVAVKRIASTPQ